MPLKLLTLNIEEDKHLDLILPYLKAEQFDVICLQEIFQKDVEALAQAANAKALFSPLSNLKGHVWGVAMLIKEELPIRASDQLLYKGSPDELPVFVPENPNIVNRGIISAEVEKNQRKYRITTTHFTWADGGGTNPEQTRDFAALTKLLDEIGETILCGDFNAPRGLELFGKLAARYKDNIPANITTSIDQNIHRVKGLQLVVDGFFSSQKYQIQDVQVIDGVSDHCGIRGNVYLNEEILL